MTSFCDDQLNLYKVAKYVMKNCIKDSSLGDVLLFGK
jgi:hypothetical protein